MECQCVTCERFIQGHEPMPCPGERARIDSIILSAIEACDDLTEIAVYDCEARPDFPVIVGVLQ